MPTEPDDDELELIRRSGVVLRVGRLSLSSGTGSYRVKASMQRVARALGIERHEAHVTLTEITTTSHRGRSFRTEVTEVRTIGVNTDRLAELEWLAQDVDRRGQVTVELVAPEMVQPDDVIDGTQDAFDADHPGNDGPLFDDDAPAMDATDAFVRSGTDEGLIAEDDYAEVEQDHQPEVATGRRARRSADAGATME